MTPQPDKEEHGIRFGCGAILGLLIAFAIAIRVMPVSYSSAIAVFIISMAICGYLAMRKGDKFWRSISAILRLIRWV